MSHASSRWLVTLCFAALSSGCGGEGVGELEFSLEAVTFTDVDPTAGSLVIDLEIRNVGDGPVLVYEARAHDDETSCGSFSLDIRPPWDAIEPGSTWRVPVVFEPDPDCEPGCGCSASGRLDLSFDVGGLVQRIPLIARGTCDFPLACSPTRIEFPEAIVASEYETRVTCHNVSEGDVVVAALEIDNSDGETVSADSERSLPRDVQLGGQLSLDVITAPTTEGEFDGLVALVGDDGATLAEVFVTGTARRERPLCSAGTPEDPDPVLETPEYEITLESRTPSSYTGVIRSFWFYNDQPPLIADVLVTSGAFADPACSVGQTGHQAHWEGVECLGGPDDLFVNVHALPYSEIADEWVRGLEIWDTVTIRGYEVDRVNYSDGSWWADAGCHTLIITWICDEEE